MGEQRHARTGRRDEILDAVAKVFRDQKRAAEEMQRVVEASGVPFDIVSAEFDDTDEIMLAVGERITSRIVACLDGEAADTEAVKQRLLAFAETLHAAYTSELVGVYRVFMTESSRRKELRSRFYDHGPHAIMTALDEFLSTARANGLVAVEESGCAAEALMGLLREPLYRELALHSSGAEAIDMTPAAAVEIFWKGCATNEEAHGSAR